MACMSAAQKSSIDMLMYYDAKPAMFNGLFDFYSYRTLKGYYPFLWYGMLYDAVGEIRCESEPEGIYTLCGTMPDGKLLYIVTNYSDENSHEREIRVDFGRNGKYEIYRLDDMHSGTLADVCEDLTLKLSANSCILIKEI